MFWVLSVGQRTSLPAPQESCRIVANEIGLRFLCEEFRIENYIVNGAELAAVA